MAEIWANFSGGHYLEEEMEMAWSHLAEAFLYHPRQALTWNNRHGRQKRSHPQNTWRHLLEAEIKSIGFITFIRQQLVPAREGCTGQEAKERGAPEE